MRTIAIVFLSLPLEHHLRLARRRDSPRRKSSPSDHSES